MIPDDTWKSLGWKHPVWDLSRYYCSLRSNTQRSSWVSDLANECMLRVGQSHRLPVDADHVSKVCEYLEHRRSILTVSFHNLRTEEEAIGFCKSLGVEVGTTRTQSTDHHQASKALVGTVTAIAQSVCKSKGLSLDCNPQTRCVWCADNGLHITARNLDGAIPALINPRIVWEIKEYWGKTKGGSKMNDAVYECNLVGRELREFEERSLIDRVRHVVFVDGAEQWSHRRSDLARFIDLLHQGLIDCLIIGREVESEWRRYLVELL